MRKTARAPKCNAEPAILKSFYNLQQKSGSAALDPSKNSTNECFPSYPRHPRNPRFKFLIEAF
jgi:hypothetical protein